jgi:hypothetical protein
MGVFHGRSGGNAMMRRKLPAVVGMLGMSIGVLALGARQALAFSAVHHGSVCMPTNSTQSAAIGYNQYGAHNTSTSARSVICPIYQTEDVNTPNADRHVSVRVYDRSPGTKLTCTVYLYGSSGNQVGAVSQSTASGFFSAAPTTLSFHFSDVGTDSITGAVFCSVPGVDSTNGHSHVVGIAWNSNTF